jgi:hypothetical protein
MAMGDGHGTGVPAGLFTAPLGLIPYLVDLAPVGLLILIVAPMMWGTIYCLADNQKIQKGPYLALSLLAIHYAGVIVLLGPAASDSNAFSDWHHLMVVSDSPIAILFLGIIAASYVFVQWKVIRIIRINWHRPNGHR